MLDRIEQGEEQIDDVIKGVVGHVDGLGQCFIDTRNVSNGVTECPKVFRNVIINDLIKNKEQFLGWDTAMQILKSEYDLDLTKGDADLYMSTFVTEYNEGAFQSGITESEERHGVQ